MATENKLLDLSYEAAEDLSSNQYHFVVLNSDGKLRRLDSAAEIAYGILQNAPESGEAASVRVDGISKLTVNAALTIGKFVKPEFVGVDDAGKGEDAGTDWRVARAFVVEAADAEDDLAGVRLVGPYPQGVGTLVSQMTVTAKIGAVVLTAAEVLGGFIDGTPVGAAAYTLPTATLMLAALSQAGIGNAIEFTVKNSAGGAHTITVASGVGGTDKGTMTVEQNNIKRFLLIVTGATTYDCYSLGTATH